MSAVKLDRTVYQISLNGKEYRLIIEVDVQCVTWELLEVKVGYEEMGDAESGPLGVVQTLEGYDLIAYGMGGPTEKQVEDFVREQLYYMELEDEHLSKLD